MVCLRIGYANAVDRAEDARQRSVWNSQRDVCQAFELAIGASLPEAVNTYFILSNNRYSYRSIAKAQRELGFSPLDSADEFFT